MVLNLGKVTTLTILSITILCGGCASNSSYWPSRPVAKLKNCIGNKYNRDGHYDTTGLIAAMAGYSTDEADRLAWFSQAPDDMAFRYSAPAVWFWGAIPGFWSYRSNVLNVLHSLHGGDHEEVLERRKRLKLEISSLRSRPKEEWKIGFLIHAFADSYAHVYGATNNLHGYSELTGHALDNGDQDNRPDMIVMNNNYRIYTEYIRELFEALAKGNTNEGLMKLEDFTARVIKAVEVDHISNDEFIEFIQSYTYCGSNKSLHEWPAIPEIPDSTQGNKQTRTLPGMANDAWEKEIEFWEVARFLTELRDRL